MAILHRIQWIDAQIRAGRYPNAGDLAEAFELSHRQALRDFAYLRDSLGAPLVYSARQRGYTYSEASFVPPGPHLTDAELVLLEAVASYYAQVAAEEQPGAVAYGRLADLLRRIGGHRSLAESLMEPSLVEAKSAHPYRAQLRIQGSASTVPASLQPYWRGENAPGISIWEFTNPDHFISALLGTGQPYRVDWPGWLRRRLQARLQTILQLNRAGMTPPVTPVPVPLTQEPERRGDQPRGEREMSKDRQESKGRMYGSWLTYMGAAFGACKAAGLLEMDFVEAYGGSGMGFHFIVHEACCPSAVTVYNWMGDHAAALDRLGILSECYLALPGSQTYEAACRRALVHIKASIDQGRPVILWGVDREEFGLVYGYDDADGVLLVSGIFCQGEEGSLPILYENLGRTAATAPILHYQVPLERVAVEPTQARRKLLVTYVERMERPEVSAAGYAAGLEAYDLWIRALTRPDLNHRGLRYLVYVYYETKDFTAAYFRRLAEALPEQPELAAIADGLQAVGNNFEAMMKVLGQQYSPPPILDQPVTPAQLKALDRLLREARASELRSVASAKEALARWPG